MLIWNLELWEKDCKDGLMVEQVYFWEYFWRANSKKFKDVVFDCCVCFYATAKVPSNSSTKKVTLSVWRRLVDNVEIRAQEGSYRKPKP